MTTRRVAVIASIILPASLTISCSGLFGSLNNPGDPFSKTISTVAGNDALGAGFSGDNGAATAAQLNTPFAVAVDSSGNLYIADTNNSVVRKVNTKGTISTFAGDYALGAGYSGDTGAATAAQLSYPKSLAFDSGGNLYIADSGNNVIREVNTSGIISTVAGTGGYSYSGDGSSATSATFEDPRGVAVDSKGDIFIADTYNNVIREVNASGIISTVAGDHALGAGYSGDGGPATSAQLNEPRAVAVDSSGNLYIADTQNYVIRKVSTSGIISTIAGNGTQGLPATTTTATSTSLRWPSSLAIDAEGNLYVSDSYSSMVCVIDPSGGLIVVAGTDKLSNGYGGDGGSAIAAQLNGEKGLGLGPSGGLYIADTSNNVIRLVK